MSHTMEKVEVKKIGIEVKKSWTLMALGAIMWTAPERVRRRKEATNG